MPMISLVVIGKEDGGRGGSAFSDRDAQDLDRVKSEIVRVDG